MMLRWFPFLLSLLLAAPAALAQNTGEQPDTTEEDLDSLSLDEPGARSPDMQRTRSAPSSGGAKKKDVVYGVGLQGRGLFLPYGFLDLFLDQGNGLASGSVGLEVVRRKGNFDLVGSINFGFYTASDGNFRGNGKPLVESDYIQFQDLNLLAFDVAFIWHHNFNRWLSLVYGAGLGFGVVLGGIYRISNVPDAPQAGLHGSCTQANEGDPNLCNPTKKGSQDEKDWRANRKKWLAEHPCPAGQSQDDPLSPCLFKEDGVWPVLPIIHLLIGLNFKITEQLNFRIDGGFHNAFYVGGATHWFF